MLPLFSYDWLHWSTFFVATFALNAAPGPDLGYIFAQTLKNGRAGGVAAMLGIWTGAFGHVLMAALGLSAILATSATVFAAVKWLGAAYLVWIGIDTLRSVARSQADAATDPAQPQAVEPAKANIIFRQGALIALLNPKTAIFFLAFLPQFVVEGAGSTGQQLFLHGVLVIAIAALIDPWLVLLGSRLSSRLNSNTRFNRWANRVLGGVFIALGAHLALMTQ